MSKLYTNPDDYYRDHKVCPSCRGDSLTSTLMGFVFRSGKPFKDENRVTCHCGWSGITHQLVPKPVRRKLEKSKADKVLTRIKKARKSDNRLYQTLRHRADILSVIKHMTQLLEDAHQQAAKFLQEKTLRCPTCETLMDADYAYCSRACYKKANSGVVVS